MGLILLILMAIVLAWWWQKVLITIRPKYAQWYWEEAVKRDPSILNNNQPPTLPTHQPNPKHPLENLSKAELIAVIRKLSQ